jgi:hypothetical protein
MKTSSKFTYQRTTSPECFRAVATGTGVTIGQSKASGELRKALVRTRPGTISKALPNEGFAAERENYPESDAWHGTLGDDKTSPGSGFVPRGPSRTI